MKKISVGATIAHAYRFAFRDFVAIVRIMWASWALLIVGALLLRRPMTAFSLAMASHDFSLMQGQWMWPLLYYLATFIVIFMQMTGLTQLALGQPAGSRYFYFSLAKPVWRLIGGMLLAVIALMAVAIAYILGVLVLGFLLRMAATAYVSPTIGRVVMGLLALLALAVGYCGLIYAAVRFFFLLAPVIVAEDRIGVTRAWTLTKGNFWRSFLIILSIMVPFGVLEIGGLLAIAGPMPWLPHSSSAADIAAFQAARHAWQVSSALQTQRLWYVIYPLSGILTALFYGLSCAAQVFAYRTLTGDEGLAPVAGD